MKRYSIITDQQYYRGGKLHEQLSTASASAKHTLSVSIERQTKFSRIIRPRNHHLSTEIKEINSEGFLGNKEQIKRLTKFLENLRKRKSEIQNPEYKVDLEQDIEVWEESIKVVKQELREMRKGRMSMIRKRMGDGLVVEKELYDEIQGEIRKRNRKLDKLNKMQAEIAYVEMKNQELQRRIRRLGEWEQEKRKFQQQSFIEGQRGIRSQQQFTQVTEEEMNDRFELLTKEADLIDERVRICDIDIELAERRVKDSLDTIQKLIMNCYHRDQTAQIHNKIPRNSFPFL